MLTGVLVYHTLVTGSLRFPGLGRPTSCLRLRLGYIKTIIPSASLDGLNRSDYTIAEQDEEMTTGLDGDEN
jgi:hypothetical protein